MKSAGDPYECFRWKSSCGRLSVRTAWVKGVRHVILSDEDLRNDNHRNHVPASGPEKEKRDTKFSAKPASFIGGDDVPPPLTFGGEDDCYAERVMRWLQKPTETICRKPMSAPPDDNLHRQSEPDLQLAVRYQELDKHRSGARRPALIKTYSIPENSRRSLDGDVRRPVKNVTDDKRSMKSVTQRSRNSNKKNHNFKTELHVHLPSMCSSTTGSTKYDNGSKVDDNDCYYLSIL